MVAYMFGCILSPGQDKVYVLNVLSFWVSLLYCMHGPYSQLIVQWYLYVHMHHHTYMCVHAPFLLAAEMTRTVIYPYDGKLEDDLVMKPGDVITVYGWHLSNDWARGTLNGKTGLFSKLLRNRPRKFSH